MLEKYLITELFAVLMVFCRIGAAIMLLPGFGEAYVSPRARLLLAVAITLVITPLVQSYMPAIPSSPLALTVLIIAETLTGAFMGMISRMLISAMHTAGMLIAFQSGLASAMMFDINAGTQGSPFGNLLSMTALMLVFAMDLHHVMIIGLADSFTLFTPGMFPPLEDFVVMAERITSATLTVAMAFAAPHLVIGLVIYLGTGVLSRLMPAMQVFFVIMPLQIALSFFLLMVTLSTAMLMYMTYFETTLTGFFTPGR